MPLFSVILTASNRGKLLRRALRSLYSQSFTDWELIVVADNPTDQDVLDTLAELRKMGSVIVKIVPLDSGDPLPKEGHPPLPIKRVAVAVNAGLDAAKGEWITYLCDDDVYLQGRFELYLPAMEYSDAVVGNALFVQESGAVWHQNKFRYRYPQPYLPGHSELLESIKPNHFICHDSICHRPSKFRWPVDIVPTPNDWRFWLTLHQSGFRFRRIASAGERATMPGLWRAGITQDAVLALTGEEMTGGTMRRVQYAKNITNKRQSVVTSKNVSILIYPGERVDAEDVSFVNLAGNKCLFPGFALCGDFSFPDVEKQERAQEPLPIPLERKVFQDEALQPPRSFEPIARIDGDSVLTTPNHQPKHPFDID